MTKVTLSEEASQELTDALLECYWSTTEKLQEIGDRMVILHEACMKAFDILVKTGVVIETSSTDKT